ncbi:MAG: PilN domain-containing protein [Clostridiales bacterium]|nr:PilN domain-containing protein [Clostridiales bacterium]
MSFAKSKNEFSKKDMNFFSEFSSGAAQQMSSAFPFFLLATVAIIAITLIVWIVCGIQIMNKQNKINDIKKEMNSASYQERLAAKDKSQAEVEDLRNYYYVVSSLDSKIASKTVADTITLKNIKAAIPDDTVLTSYHEVDGVIEINGQSLNRESALNYLHLLDDMKIFSSVEDSIKPIDPSELGYDKTNLMFGNMGYTFKFVCTRDGHVNLTHSSFVDGDTPTPLEPLITESKHAGEAYSLTQIATKTVDGVEYTLTNVKINGTAVSPETLAEYIAKDEISGKMSGNVNIELMYTANNGGAS